MVVPVLDEAAALPGLLEELTTLDLLGSCVFVDNGSADGGPELIRAAGGRVVVERRRGYGYACLRGLEVARDAGAAVVVFMEADGTDDPADVDRLVGPVLRRDLDLLIGSRRSALRGRPIGARGVMPWHQRLGNVLSVFVLRLLFGLRLPDNGPFRAVRLDLLERLEMESRAYAWTTEMTVKAHLVGARIAWVETAYRVRKGDSKIGGSARGTLGAFLGIFGTMWRLRTRFVVGSPERQGP